jgi:hypothetical protein
MKSNGDERKSSGGHFLVIKKTILMSKDVIWQEKFHLGFFLLLLLIFMEIYRLGLRNIFYSG